MNSGNIDDEVFRVNSLYYIFFLIFWFICVVWNLLNGVRCNVLIEIIFILFNKGVVLLYLEKVFISRFKYVFMNML